VRGARVARRCVRQRAARCALALLACVCTRRPVRDGAPRRAGFGGTTQRVASVEDKIAAHAGEGDAAMAASAAREARRARAHTLHSLTPAPHADVARAHVRSPQIVVTFNADVADGMPWRFFPAQRSVTVRPGESTLAFYTAHNTSDEPITGACGCAAAVAPLARASAAPAGLMRFADAPSRPLGFAR
jgi:cytochrome c oxidase assembly protein Cox11